MSTLLKGQSAETLESAIASALATLHGRPVVVKLSGLAWREPNQTVGRYWGKSGTLVITELQVHEVEVPEPFDPTIPF